MGPNNPLRAIIIPNDSRRNSINLSVFFVENSSLEAIIID